MMENDVMTRHLHGEAVNAWVKAPLSVFQSLTVTTPIRTTTLPAFISEVRSGTYREGVERIRRYASQGDKMNADRGKRTLPAITPGGLYGTRKKVDKASGIVHLDFDGLPPGDIEHLRKKANAEPSTAACMVSPSGNGLKVFFPFDASLQGHNEAYSAACDLCISRGLPSPDPHAKDHGRLCFYSYDPKAYFNQDAEFLRITHAPACLKQSDGVDGVTEEQSNGGDGVTKVTEVTEAIMLGCAQSSLLTPLVLGAIAKTIPKDMGNRHKRLFDFARELKAITETKDLPMMDLRPVLKEWFRQALPCISSTDFAETFGAFSANWKNVHTPAGKNPVEAALEVARTLPRPDWCKSDEYSSEFALLARLCEELQRRAGAGVFFLSCRDAANRIGVSNRKANAYLHALATEGKLLEVEKGKINRASRYRWVWNSPLAAQS